MRARELGYRLMISSASANDDGKELIAAVTSGGLVDGLAVMISEVETRIRSTLQKVRTPLVIIDGDVEGASYDTVLVDQRIGASALVSHLIKNCRARRIVFVGGPETNIDTRHRFGAFREEIAQRDLQLRPADVIYLDYRYDSAYELGVKCVADWAAGQAAIFAANDEMAAGIIDAALAAGLKLPSDLPIVGFDDTRLASMTRPRLTTVRVPVWRMGAAAVELLVQRIDDVDRPQETLVLPSELVVRESCGASSRTAE